MTPARVGGGVCDSVNYRNRVPQRIVRCSGDYRSSIDYQNHIARPPNTRLNDSDRSWTLPFGVGQHPLGLSFPIYDAALGDL
jgi:hypothetical protein